MYICIFGTSSLRYPYWFMLFILLQNYENMFYSYDFNTGPPTTGRFEPRFTTGAGVNPVTKETEHWVGMSLNSKFDGEGMKKHGRPHLNLVVGMYMYCM